MAFTPLSEVHLVELPIDIDNKNQLTFSNSTQMNYFNAITFRKKLSKFNLFKKR